MTIPIRFTFWDPLCGACRGGGHADLLHEGPATGGVVQQHQQQQQQQHPDQNTWTSLPSKYAFIAHLHICVPSLLGIFWWWLMVSLPTSLKHHHLPTLAALPKGPDLSKLILYFVGMDEIVNIQRCQFSRVMHSKGIWECNLLRKQIHNASPASSL